MPPWGPTKRRVLISGLRSLGFEGPFSGGKHEFMVRVDKHEDGTGSTTSSGTPAETQVACGECI